MADYMLGLYEKSMPNTLSVVEKLQEAKLAGYDYFELSVDETDEKLARLDWSTDIIDEINRAQQETGIFIKSICLSGHRKFPLGSESSDVQAHSLDIMERTIKLAVKLGARIVMLAGYDVYYDESNEKTKQNFTQNLKKGVQMAAKYGVTLAFETMETPFMNTVRKAVLWVNQINSPYLQVYPDIGNIVNASLIYGTDPIQDLETAAGHIVALHLKETTPGIYREVPYSTGHVDFAAHITKAYALGVRLFVGEFWYTGEANWRKTLQDNNAFLRSFLTVAEKNASYEKLKNS